MSEGMFSWFSAAEGMGRDIARRFARAGARAKGHEHVSGECREVVAEELRPAAEHPQDVGRRAAAYGGKGV